MPIRYKLVAAAALLAASWGLDSVRAGRPRSWAGISHAKPVRIVRFFASALAVSPGGSAMLCYGVENARSVQIAPLEGVYASSSECLEVAPDRTTSYTILAEGFDGTVAVRSLILPVESEPPAHPQFPQVATLLSTEPLRII